tara:strand:+ start:55 stop:291 length:237 start_codon:yes stop_codon:yes gene_type:complete
MLLNLHRLKKTSIQQLLFIAETLIWDNSLKAFLSTSLPGDHRELVPPEPIPNSAVKWFFADGSVGLPHARVGHCQVLN